MDISKQYIKMCDCEEIQGQRPQPSDGNSHSIKEHDRDYTSLFYLPKESKVEVLKWDNDEERPIIGGYHDKPEGAIWLPYQHQLQEMVNTKDIYSFAIWCYPELSCPHVDADTYCSICLEDRNTKERAFTSMEQLWLTFVMKENHKKVWREGWVKA